MSKVKTQDYYVYTHSINGQPPFYIGKGTKKRISAISRKHNKHHTNIVNKYGKENIIVRSMLCRNEQHAFELEVKLISALRNDGVKLVNCTDGGEGGSGYEHTDEAKLKIALSSTGRKASEETKAKLSVIHAGKVVSEETKAKRAGYKHSDETRFKISNSQKGKIISEESKAKMAIAAKGRIVSDETKVKLSEAAKNRPPVSEETRLKLSIAAKNRTDETKAKMSAAQKNRLPISEETRKKMSVSQKLRWLKNNSTESNLEYSN